MKSAAQHLAHAASRRKSLSLLLVAVAAVLGVITMHAVTGSDPRSVASASSAALPETAIPAPAALAGQPSGTGGDVLLWPASCDLKCGTDAAALMAFCVVALLSIAVGLAALARALVAPLGGRASPRAWFAVQVPVAGPDRFPVLTSLCISRT